MWDYSDRWRDIKRNKPRSSSESIVYCQWYNDKNVLKTDLLIGKYKNGAFSSDGYKIENVTHWCPIGTSPERLPMKVDVKSKKLLAVETKKMLTKYEKKNKDYPIVSINCKTRNYASGICPEELLDIWKKAACYRCVNKLRCSSSKYRMSFKKPHWEKWSYNNYDVGMWGKEWMVRCVRWEKRGAKNGKKQ